MRNRIRTCFHSSGFTLVEMMVVLIIIGIIVSSVVLSINTDKIEEHMDTEVRRIQALLNLARDEAVLQGQEMAMTVEENSYLFEVLVEGGWEPIEGDQVFRQREVLDGTELALIVDDLEINLETTKEEDKDSSDSGPSTEKRPRVFILSSGEFMPFELILRTLDDSIEFRVKVGEDGELELVTPEDFG